MPRENSNPAEIFFTFLRKLTDRIAIGVSPIGAPPKNSLEIMSILRSQLGGIYIGNHVNEILPKEPFEIPSRAISNSEFKDLKEALEIPVFHKTFHKSEADELIVKKFEIQFLDELFNSYREWRKQNRKVLPRLIYPSEARRAIESVIEKFDGEADFRGLDIRRYDDLLRLIELSGDARAKGDFNFAFKLLEPTLVLIDPDKNSFGFSKAALRNLNGAACGVGHWLGQEARLPAKRHRFYARAMSLRGEDPFFALFEQTADRYDNPNSTAPAVVYDMMVSDRPKTQVSSYDFLGPTTKYCMARFIFKQHRTHPDVHHRGLSPVKLLDEAIEENLDNGNYEDAITELVEKAKLYSCVKDHTRAVKVVRDIEKLIHELEVRSNRTSDFGARQSSLGRTALLENQNWKKIDQVYTWRCADFYRAKGAIFKAALLSGEGEAMRRESTESYLLAANLYRIMGDSIKAEKMLSAVQI